MTDFNKLFFESKAKLLNYKDKTIVQNDALPVFNSDKLLITLESTNNIYLQGIFLKIFKQGIIEIEGEQCDKPIALWEDFFKENNEPVEITVYPKKKKQAELLVIYNIWKDGNGDMDSRHYGAAMIIEEIENGRRYRCNDGYPDENFDDIVFTVQKLTQ